MHEKFITGLCEAFDLEVTEIHGEISSTVPLEKRRIIDYYKKRGLIDKSLKVTPAKNAVNDDRLEDIQAGATYKSRGEMAFICGQILQD